MNRRNAENLTLGLLGLYVAGSLYLVVSMATGVKVSFMLVAFCTCAFFVFACVHATLALGPRHAFVFWLISSVVCLAFELLGTSRGWIYGAYAYSDRLGPKILDLVPMLIPLAWFMMMYASYTLANTLGARASAPASTRSLARLLGLTFLSALIMTSWDLMNDPISVAGGHWSWMEDGAYFGIPLSNYAGWMLTTLVVFLLYRLFERSRAPTSSRPQRSYFHLLPLIAYAVTLLANVAALTIAGQPAPAMVGLFSMGAFLAAAVAQRL